MKTKSLNSQKSKTLEIINSFDYETEFDSKDLVHKYNSLYFQKNETILLSSMYWLLSEFVEKGELLRIKRGIYQRNKRNKSLSLDYIKSKTANELSNLIQNEFEHIEMQIWESNLLNQFLNHQMAINIIFVEIEKGFSYDVFEFINQYLQFFVLFNPKIELFNQMIRNNIIIVQNLISESPRQTKNKQIAVEKLIVDIFKNKYIKEIIPRSEYKNIIESLNQKYMLNNSKLIRYAKRRNANKLVEKYLL